MQVLTANMIAGGVAALGALAYCVWGFIKALEATKKTPQKEKFSYLKAFMTIAPSLVAGFLAGYQVDMGAAEIVALLVAGWGAADIGNRAGVNGFFDE